MKTKCHRIVSEDSQNHQRYIHIIHSYINLYNSPQHSFKSTQFFRPIFTQNETTLLLCLRETVTEKTALCWTVFIYHELFKSRLSNMVLMII